jgi:hypothetical protein
MQSLPTTRASIANGDWWWRAVPVSVMFVALLFSIRPAQALDLRTVMENTAVAPPAQVGFQEERHNPIFEEPMLLTGRLEYLASGTLRKVIETPFEEDILIEADHVIVARDGETRKLALNRSRALKTILGAIEAILSGNSDELEAVFHCELSGTDDAWALQMTPISRSVARRITRLEVRGDDQSVTSIRINLQDDEWHLMSITRNSLEP